MLRRLSVCCLCLSLRKGYAHLSRSLERRFPGGNTFVGVCAAKFSCWDTAWWEEGRHEHEPYIFGLFDRGTLTRPSHDRHKDWLERSRYRNGPVLVCARAEKASSKPSNAMVALDTCIRPVP